MDNKMKVEQGPVLTRRGFLGAAAAAAGTALATANAATTAVASAGKAASAQNGAPEVMDIVIIGAGLAGLTAARDLQKAGCDSFLVLEARNRVGGRTLNHDLGNGYFTEAGGQWIGPGQTAIADLARELGVGTFPAYWHGKASFISGNATARMESTGGFDTDRKLTQELEELSKLVPSGAPWKSPRAAELDAMTLGDWLARKNVAPADQIGWATGVALSGGTSPARLSMLHWLSMINSADSVYDRLEAVKGGAQETRISGGSQVLSFKMATALGDKLRLDSPVLRIENWRDGPVDIHTPKGVIRAGSVIVALSPPLCNQITFDPPLPLKRREMQRRWPTFAPARKTAHVYKKPFWREKGLNGWIFQPQGPVLWAYDNSPEDGSFGVINAFVANSWLPSDTKAAGQELSRIYAQAFGDEALHPVAYHDHDWGKCDKWTLTCISPMPRNFLTTYGEALHPPAGRLIWSGTETADIWAGYMDGAVRSGHQAALQALQAINERRA